MLLGQEELDRGMNPLVICWGPRVERAWQQIVQPTRKKPQRIQRMWTFNLNSVSLQFLKPKMKVLYGVFFGYIANYETKKPLWLGSSE